MRMLPFARANRCPLACSAPGRRSPEFGPFERARSRSARSGRSWLVSIRARRDRLIYDRATVALSSSRRVEVPAIRLPEDLRQIMSGRFSATSGPGVITTTASDTPPFQRRAAGGDDDFEVRIRVFNSRNTTGRAGWARICPRLRLNVIEPRPANGEVPRYWPNAGDGSAGGSSARAIFYLRWLDWKVCVLRIVSGTSGNVR